VNRIPRGFTSAAEFERFAALLKGGLADAGYNDTEAAFQGSSVTGVKYTSGAPFDVGRVSDYDVALAGRGIFGAAENAGISLRAGGTRTGPLSPDDLDALGLTNLSERLSKFAGRDVHFMIFDSLGNAVGRSPSIVVP
jgi:filamentous hemagglutinin